MSKLSVVGLMDVAYVTATRGTGAANMLTRDPKEVWADDAIGSPATFAVDLGYARPIDTICLVSVRPPAAGATWSVTGGITSSDEITIQATTLLRVPDIAGGFSASSHALWTGAPVTVRFLSISVNQPAGPPLTVGRLAIGLGLVADMGQEWGAGRQPIDTGTATALPSGGFAIVEGVRKRRYSWTFGDLSIDEADRFEQLALAVGETAPVLVIEDAVRTAGLRGRIWYAKFEKWKEYERRNRRQTRWEMAVEEWL